MANNCPLMTMFFNYLPMCSSPISSGSVLHYYLPRCSLQHPPPKKNLTGVLKTTPWIYFAKWDKAGCDKKNNLLVCTALMSSFCFSFCAKYLMFNDGFLRKISAHCQESAPSRCSFDPFDFDGAHPRSSAGHHWIDNGHTMSSEETYLEHTKVFRCL